MSTEATSSLEITTTDDVMSSSEDGSHCVLCFIFGAAAMGSLIVLVLFFIILRLEYKKAVMRRVTMDSREEIRSSEMKSGEEYKRKERRKRSRKRRRRKSKEGHSKEKVSKESRESRESKTKPAMNSADTDASKTCVANSTQSSLSLTAIRRPRSPPKSNEPVVVPESLRSYFEYRDIQTARSKAPTPLECITFGSDTAVGVAAANKLPETQSTQYEPMVNVNFYVKENERRM
ncbi:hypothetical protein Q1695_009176 [Nippostrongylus brasiliensis]|nr:hypothetical protein Q1695_009176 [Nippostrongylus brasiliensis]